MSKIKLSLESLRVESFATEAVGRGEGIFDAMKTDDGCSLSAIDLCPSSPHAMTMPCNGCVGTELC